MQMCLKLNQAKNRSKIMKKKREWNFSKQLKLYLFGWIEMTELWL